MVIFVLNNTRFKTSEFTAMGLGLLVGESLIFEFNPEMAPNSAVNVWDRKTTFKIGFLGVGAESEFG